MSEPRPLYVIAREILSDPTLDRTSRNFATPYLSAMSVMVSIDESYGADSGRSIVAYAIGNLKTWRSESARALKAELRALK